MGTENVSSMRSEKDPWIYTVFLLFLGFMGVHRFYSGKTGLGIAYLFTGGFFGIGVLVDVIVLLANGVYDSNGAHIEVSKSAKVLVILLIVIALLQVIVVGTVFRLIMWAVERSYSIELFERFIERFMEEYVPDASYKNHTGAIKHDADSATRWCRIQRAL